MLKPSLCALLLFAIGGLTACTSSVAPVPAAPLARPAPPAPELGHEPRTQPGPEPTVSLIFVGDIMLDRVPGNAVAQGADPFEGFAGVLQSADLAVGNLECVIATGGERVQKLYNFRCHPRNVPLLAHYFDAVSVANNHAGDSGPSGFAEMLKLLEAGGVRYFGGGLDAREAHTPLILERNGLRIALLAYNEVELRSYEAGPDRPGLAWSVDEQVVADIKAARERADFVVVYPHWGLDYRFQPSERQQALAHEMVDAGADLVVGSHPHVTETVESYKQGLIVYCLGNFVFDDFLDVPPELQEPSRTSWVLRVTAGRGGVRHWDTLVARTDDSGLPRPVRGARSPCSRPESKEIGQCSGD
jgi:poly-gamma-glutamate capsule biosynthesis protein CapA/YwtB (metallophosphatase superfamily)